MPFGHPSGFAVIAVAFAAVFLFFDAAKVQSRAAATTSLPFRGDVFGHVEFRSLNPDKLPHWTRVRQAIARKSRALASCMGNREFCVSPAQRRWRRLISRAAVYDLRGKLDTIHRAFNRLAYRSDFEVYGDREYWANPTEFLTRSGDCEDYAIAKFFALRALGFANDEMTIAVLLDPLRQTGHAVLAVREGDGILVLDNRSATLLSQERYEGFRLRYLVNESGYWRPRHVTLADVLAGARLAEEPR